MIAARGRWLRDYDDPLVHVTRSMAEALEMLKVSEGDFEPVGKAST